VEREGALSTDERLIEQLVRSYVAFSGRNFPHILVPLMAERRVMINPERPLVIYESMSFELRSLAIAAPTLELIDSQLQVQGKRGEARLSFQIRAGGQAIGTGLKTLLLSGLREYDEALVGQLVEEYAARVDVYGRSYQEEQ
jgi:hypothetical protein